MVLRLRAKQSPYHGRGDDPASWPRGFPATRPDAGAGPPGILRYAASWPRRIREYGDSVWNRPFGTKRSGHFQSTTSRVYRSGEALC